MSSLCKTPSSVAGTCKTAGGVAGTCKTAVAVYGINPELSVLEIPDYEATSTYEGAITPASYVYTVKNIGDAPMDWTAAADQAWVGLDVTSGTLLPGEEATITVTIDNTLLFGTNTSTITFTNSTDGDGNTTRGVELVVTGTLPLTLEGRTLASSATLIGHSEFTSASTPPKKYLIKTLSGELKICNYGNFATCASGPLGAQGQFTYRYSGALTYNAVTGALVDTTVLERDNANVICGANPVLTNLGHVATAVETITYTTQFNRTVTKTTNVQTSDMTCVSGGILHSPNPERVTGVSNRDDLSSEDTEDNAVSRMVAAGSFSAWGAISTQGDKKASAASRAAFTFNSTAAQYKGTRAGLAPSRLFNGQVTLYRRAVGSADPWVEVSTLTFSATTDGSGNFSYSSTNLPTVTGYEYCVFNAVLTS